MSLRDNFTFQKIVSKIFDPNPPQIIFGDTDKNYKEIKICDDSCSLNLDRYRKVEYPMKNVNIYRDISEINNKRIVIDLGINIAKPMTKCDSGVDPCVHFGDGAYYLKQIIIQKSARFLNYKEYPLELNLIHQSKEHDGTFLIICVILSPDSTDLLGDGKSGLLFDEIFNDVDVIIKSKTAFNELGKYDDRRLKIGELLPTGDSITFETYEFKNKYWNSGNVDGFTKMVILNKVCKVSCKFLLSFAKNILEKPIAEWTSFCDGKGGIPKNVQYDPRTNSGEIQIYQGRLRTDIIEGYEIGEQRRPAVVETKKDESSTNTNTYYILMLSGFILFCVFELLYAIALMSAFRRGKIYYLYNLIFILLFSTCIVTIYFYKTIYIYYIIWILVVIYTITRLFYDEIKLLLQRHFIFFRSS